MQSEANARCSTAHASQNISPRISQGNIIYASTNMNRSKCYYYSKQVLMCSNMFRSVANLISFTDCENNQCLKK